MCKDGSVHKILCIGKLGGQNNRVSLSGKPNWPVKAFSKIMLQGLELHLKPEVLIVDGENQIVVQSDPGVPYTVTLPAMTYTIEDFIPLLLQYLALYTGGSTIARSHDYQINHNGGLLEIQLSTFQNEVQRLVTDWQVVSGEPDVTDTGDYTGVAGVETCQIVTSEQLPNAGFRFSGTVTLPRNFQVYLTSSSTVLLAGVGIKGQGAALTTTITNAGTAYVDAVGVATTGGTGTGLTVDITTAAGLVTVVTINEPGTGYTAADVLTITGGAGDATFTVDTISAGLYNTTFDDVEIATAVAPLVGDTFVIASTNTAVSIQVRNAAGALRFAPRAGTMTLNIWDTTFSSEDAQWFVESDQSSVVELTNIRTAHYQTDEDPSDLTIKFGATRLAKTLGFQNVGPWNDQDTPAVIRATTALGQFFDIPSVSVVISGGPFRIDGYQYTPNTGTGQQRNVVETIINPTINNTILRYNADYPSFVELNNSNDFIFTTIEATFFNDINGQPLEFIAPPVVAFNIMNSS